MILKKLIFGCFLMILPSMVLGQNVSSQNYFWKRVRYGGSLGLGFFNGGFNASVSPSAIYPVSNDFSAGASLNFNYAKFNDNKLVAYGGSILSLYNPIPQVQLSAELEQLRINR